MAGIGRNDPCPCGSGKKYKKCCMDKDEQAERRERAEATEYPAFPEPYRRPERLDRAPVPRGESETPAPGPEEAEPDWETDEEGEWESEPEPGDIIEMSVDEAIDLLEQMGVEESAEAFGAFCGQEGARSIRPRVAQWASAAGIDLATEAGGKLRCAAVALWRELSPGLACMEDLDDLVCKEEKKLDARGRSDRSVLAEAWLRAWNILRGLLPESVRSLPDADALLVAGGPLGVFLEELEGLLWAGARNKDKTEWLGKTLAFGDSVRERFRDDQTVALKWGIWRAQVLFALGRTEEGEAQFTELAATFPEQAAVYQGWALVYAILLPRKWFPDRPERAIEILRRGLERVPESERGALFTTVREIERGIPRDRSEPRAYVADPMTRGLMESGRHVALDVWRGLVERGAEAVPLLNEIMDDVVVLISDEGLPGLDAKKAAWGPTRAAFIAASIGDPSSVPFLLKVAAVDDGNEMVAEGMEGFPIRFGQDAVWQFLGFCLDESVGTYPRGLCVKGVVRAGGRWPELKEGIANRLAEAIESEEHDGEMVTWLARAAVHTGHPRVTEAVLQAGERDGIDPGIAGDAEELVEVPADWYAKARPMPSSAEEHFRECRRTEGGRGVFTEHPAGTKSRKKKAKKFGKSKKKRR